MLRFNNRYWKAAILALILFLTYIVAFFSIVGCVHVTWGFDAPRPRPQYVMFVSNNSIRANQNAHLVFAPLIWFVELTGEFQYVEDGRGFLDPASLLPRYWSILTGR